jgi:hypothetical protein
MPKYLTVPLLAWTWGTIFTGSLQAGPIAFLVAERPSQASNNDSYVIVIDDSNTALIGHARSIVAWIQGGENPATEPDDKIIVTAIEKGPNGINRDLLAPGEPLWSWHPVGTPEFFGATIEILDGWPSFVEGDIDGWIANTGGNIGFWSYTVVSELGVVPEPGTVWLGLYGSILVIGWARWSTKSKARRG